MTSLPSTARGADAAGRPSPAITFLGAAGTVTGSRYLVEVEGARVLVDCGLFQGSRALRDRNWAPCPVDPKSIDAVVLTHAHLDHTGYLPRIVREGFAGPVYATPYTAELARIVLEDSARLQEEDAAYANRKGFTKHHPALPLYDHNDARRAIAQLVPVPFGAHVGVAAGTEVELRRAGHILGSSSALLTLPGGARLFISGDVGRPAHPLLLPPEPFPAADVALVESTYGHRQHESEEEALDQLAGVITRTAARGGAVVVPAFAVDRTEVVLHAISQLRQAGRMPALPVHVDSPMALAVLRVYQDAVAKQDPELRAGLREHDPFDVGELHAERTRDESKAINDITGPMIIISSSGMATGGRVLHHLAQRLPDPRNAVVLVGYQAEGTRGRALADGAQAVKIFGAPVPVRADVTTVGAFSVHADSDELIAWMRPAPPPHTTFLVHGEASGSAALRDRVTAELGWAVSVPALGDVTPVG